MADPESTERGRHYWNRRALTYPRFEEGEDTLEAEVLRLARAHGVDFGGKSVLDVGCGSGKYTLRLAREAARVVAVDISDEMLRILREDAAGLGMRNIRCVRSAWEDFAADERFGIVFAALTPAVHNDASREKLMNFAAGQLVHVAFDRHMYSDVLQGLYSYYGVQSKIFNDVKDTRAWLEGRGTACTVAPVRGRRVTLKTREELVLSCATRLRERDVEPDMAHLTAYAEAFRQPSGLYAESVDLNLDILIWRA